MQEHFIQINGLQLCVASIGRGPAVLISHGWLDHAGSWFRVASKIAAEGYRVIIPDQRGYGRSEHVPPCTHYHFPDYVADYVSLLEALEVGKYALIGHSMGGTISSLLAGLHSSPPTQLILIDGLGPEADDPERACQRYQQHLRSRLEPKSHLPMQSIEVAARKYMRLNPYLSLTEAEAIVTRIVQQDKHGQWFWRWDPRHRERSASAFDSLRHQEVLANITCPTALIFGRTSWYKQISDLDDRISAIQAPCETHWIESGHSPHLQCPEGLSTLLLKLLRRP